MKSVVLLTLYPRKALSVLPVTIYHLLLNMDCQYKISNIFFEFKSPVLIESGFFVVVHLHIDGCL